MFVLLILLTLPDNSIEQCDVLEYNTVLDSEYKISCEQWLFWNFDEVKKKYVISDFIVANLREKLTEGQLKQKERELVELLKIKERIAYIPQVTYLPIYKKQEYYYLKAFSTRTQRYHDVKSKMFVESITTYDPEMENRVILPVNERISILK
jgi:hypothetical protein